jgi:dephospho-CoA kinase
VKKIIAITGVIGSGKSLAAKILTSLGGRTVDADDLARQAIAEEKILKQIKSEFGETVFLNEITLNRQALAEIVFNHQDKLLKLEGIIHPKVKELFNKEVEEFLKKPDEIALFYIVPLLFEKNIPLTQFDHTVLISCPDEMAIKRAMARGDQSEESIRKRFNKQFSNEEKLKLADIAIHNIGSEDDLKDSLKRYWESIIKSSNIVNSK